MSTQALIWFLVIGVVAGWLAGRLMKAGPLGLVGDLVVGVLGAFIGGWVFGLLGIAAGGLLGAIVTAVVGAMLLLGLLRLINRA